MTALPGLLEALDPVELNPLTNRAVARRYPALERAFATDAMTNALDDALAGGRGCVAGCRPVAATYAHRDGCALRYEVEVDAPGGERTRTVVNARLFASGADAVRHAGGRLATLARRVSEPARATPFPAQVACLKTLPMALSVFPVDGDLPTLVEATDPERVRVLLERVHPGADQGWSASLERYARGRRCVLRYTNGDHAVVGKVIGNGCGSDAHAALARLSAAPFGGVVRVPRPLGYDAGLRLLLLEPVGGRAVYSSRIKAYLRGEAPDDSAAVGVVERCADMAVALHSISWRPPNVRRAEDDLARLVAAAGQLATVAPGLSHTLGEAAQAIAARLARTEPLPMCLCHGDYKHNQLLGEGPGATLIDFDTACRAEPALDLGQFAAYLRLKGALLEADEAAERLVIRFLVAYATAAGLSLGEMERLSARTALFELLSLAGRAIHSWLKFKPERLMAVMTVLEGRMACLEP